MRIKKHNLSQKQKLYNSINKYLNDDIDDQELDNAMYHYIGKRELYSISEMCNITQASIHSSSSGTGISTGS